MKALKTAILKRLEEAKSLALFDGVKVGGLMGRNEENFIEIALSINALMDDIEEKIK